MGVMRKNPTAGAVALAGLPSGPRLDSKRGLLAMRAEASPMAAIEALNRAFEEFKASQDQKIAELRKGFDDVVQTEKVDRINADVAELQTAIDDLGRTLAAAQLGGGAGDDVDPALAPALAEHRKAYLSWFRRGLDANLRELEIKAALTTDKDPDGGYTVTPQTDTAIDRILGTVSTIRGLASVMTISAASYKKLVSQGGATGGWVGERAARTETDTPTLAGLEFPAMEMYANPAATQTLLDDSAVNIEAWLADEVSITFAETEGSAFYNGDGVEKPRGLASYTMIADASWAWGKVGFKVSGVAAALSDGSNNGVDALTDLVYSLKQGYRANASWLMNRTTAGTVRKLKTIGDTAAYLWQPSVQVGQPATLLGYPVADDDNVADIGANAFPIWFGDFRRGYLIVDRTGTRVLRDPYTNKPYVHFYTTKRTGGGIQNFQAIKALKIST